MLLVLLELRQVTTGLRWLGVLAVLSGAFLKVKRLNMEFQVMRVARNVFDVFQGKQWGTWSRLRAGRNGVYVADGERLSYDTTRQLAASIDPREEKQLVTLN